MNTTEHPALTKITIKNAFPTSSSSLEPSLFDVESLNRLEIRVSEHETKRPLWLILRQCLTCAGQNRLVNSLSQQIKDANETSNALGKSERLENRKSPLGLILQNANQNVTTDPFLIDLGKKSFDIATHATSHANGYDALALQRKRSTFTSLGWLYGPNSCMPAHYDSLTFEGSEDEWLVSFNVGLSVRFAADDECITLHSGDVLFMDTHSVKHGVIGVIPDSAPIDCAIQDARLGVMLWETFDPNLSDRETIASQALAAVDGINMLFTNDNTV